MKYLAYYLLYYSNHLLWAILVAWGHNTHTVDCTVGLNPAGEAKKKQKQKHPLCFWHFELVEDRSTQLEEENKLL